SKLLNEEQKERPNQLVEIVLATTPVREASDEQLVRLPTGDGMALVFRRSAEEPAPIFLPVFSERQRRHFFELTEYRWNLFDFRLFLRAVPIDSLYVSRYSLIQNVYTKKQTDGIAPRHFRFTNSQGARAWRAARDGNRASN